jgi:hypothetical protein
MDDKKHNTQKKEKINMSKKLLREVAQTSQQDLSDVIFAMAKNVEDALIKGGAEPGKDYTIKDLFDWGLPFALEVFKSKQDIEYTVSNF